MRKNLKEKKRKICRYEMKEEISRKSFSNASLLLIPETMLGST